jgi:uncharacterized protein (DUF4415 family)
MAISREEQLRILGRMKDSDIKVPVTLMLDPNILAWYKQQVPHGYQTLINNVLQKYMTDHQA